MKRLAGVRLSIIAVLLAAGPALAEDEPALSADGKRIELHEAEYKLCGGAATTVFCDAGADVDDRCTRYRVGFGCGREDTGTDDASRSIEDTEDAGGFKPVSVIALHRIVQHEMLDAQEITRARVTRTSGGLTISVAAGAKLSASITVRRGKKKIAAARWECQSYGGDQAAITRAAIVGGEVYAELTCSTYHHWLRVPR